MPAHREHRATVCSSPTSPSSTTKATRPSTPTASTGTPSRSRTGTASNPDSVSGTPRATGPRSRPASSPRTRRTTSPRAWRRSTDSPTRSSSTTPARPTPPSRIARDLGATVIEGYWDDDFSRARNAALEHCSGDWIAWLDADETLVCDDIAGLLAVLEHDGPQDRRLLRAHRQPDRRRVSGRASSTRPAACSGGLAANGRAASTSRWPGRGDHRGIQQVPLERPGSCTRVTSTRPCGPATRPSATSGWPRPRWPRPTAGRRASRSPAWAAPTSPPDASKRPSTTAGRRLDHTDNPITRRLATRTAAEALTHLGRFDEALEWIDTLRAISTLVGAGRHRRGQDPPGPGGIPERRSTCSTGSASASSTTTASRSAGTCSPSSGPRRSSGLGRTSDAADVLLEVLVDQGVIDVHLGILVDSLQPGRPVPRRAGRRHPGGQGPATSWPRCCNSPPDTADEVLEACFGQMDDTRVVLATAATLACRLPIDRALHVVGPHA